MVQRIHSKFQKASNATKALLLHLLRTDGPIRPDYSDEEAASSLVDMGIAVKVDVVQLALAGSYVRMLLLRMAYPRRHVDPTIVVPRRKDGSIDGLSLLRLALQYVDRDVIYDPLSRNRTGSAEAVIQAELYAVLRGIGCVSAKFTTLVEVKHPQGEEMPLDLLLLDKDTSAAVVGYELKVQLLRKSEIVNAVRNQAVRYKNDHQISQMYLVNFFSTECTRDADIPGSIDDVTCVMIKYESGFENLHVEVPSGCSTPKA
ncbi:hypothetical protein BC832DRAFT_156919 [Gaertneriomyces semiglobifer]|nr:hypothetical protein BC832DRAFT_156919 [Gaertneriomyces semiglobifer]